MKRLKTHDYDPSMKTTRSLTRMKNILETTDNEIERKRGRQGRIRKKALGNGCVAQLVERLLPIIRGPRFK